MEGDRFDGLTRRMASLLSRRTVTRGGAGIAGAVALGGLLGDSDVEAKKKKKKDCRKKGCPAPSDPCQVATCTRGKKKKNGRKRRFTCVVSNAADDSTCGTDKICRNGVCRDTCPQNSICSGGQTCCNNACVNIQTDINYCGSCSNSCDASVADRCVGGQCRCGGGAACNPDVADNCDDGNCMCGNAPACGVGELCVGGTCVGDCSVTDDACDANADCCSGACTCGSNPEAGVCLGDFSQNFQRNAQGWEGVSRVPSGTNGIAARSGSYYGQALPDGAAVSRLGGYTNVFPADGYAVELWIHLDPAGTANGRVFDYTSAVSQPDCAHRRDFNFRVGKSAGGDFCIGASNNAGGPACDASGNPATITATGWYLFRHTFTGEVGSPVSCLMEVEDSLGATVFSKTSSPAADIVGTTVGGNRYAWFPNPANYGQTPFPFIAIDDSSRSLL
ncbi:MAG: hypothetical protein KC442_12325 [Thermomicrobiales bacterium]|nr:hypothetical protein [Thermomicrobiales bacterium]